MSEKLVCVTGGSGYIASWIVKLLLQRGYTVRASVRDPSDPNKTEHLRALDGASERLHFYKADLLEEGSFDAAIAGCVGVFHTASPCLLNETNFQCARQLIQTFDFKYYTLITGAIAQQRGTKDINRIHGVGHSAKEIFFTGTTGACAVKIPQRAELIDPAVKGTLNVLRSCATASSVKRVVMTSSMASVNYNGRAPSPDVVVDETWFSDPDFCVRNKLWYQLSKILAEEAACKFSKQIGVELVTINPGLVIGPILQPTLNLSSSFIYNLINGSTTFPNLCLPWIHVKDVAMAHILTYEIHSAHGRYCLVDRVAHFSEVVEIICKLYPSIPVPEKCADDKPFETVYQVSKEKARSLGLNFTPLEQSIKETTESLKEKGFVIF